MKKMTLLLWILCFLFNYADGGEKVYLKKFMMKSGELHLSYSVQLRRYFDTILHYVHSSFKVEEIFFSPLRESGVAILLSVETIKPLSF